MVIAGLAAALPYAGASAAQRNRVGILFFSDAVGVHLRSQAREQLGHDGRPSGVQRLIEIHHERDWSSAHERQRDVVPVALGLILDDRPALELARRRFVFEQQPITRLPHWRLDDVAESNAAIAGAGEVDGDGLLVLVARLYEGGECDVLISPAEYSD